MVHVIDIYQLFVLVFFFFFFFKQKTAYEIVSRDWSSDVCSSDLVENLNCSNNNGKLYQTNASESINAKLQRFNKFESLTLLAFLKSIKEFFGYISLVHQLMAILVSVRHISLAIFSEKFLFNGRHCHVKIKPSYSKNSKLWKCLKTLLQLTVKKSALMFNRPAAL